MKKHSLFSILTVCLFFVRFSAQAQQRRLQFIDRATHTPLSAVSVVSAEGNETAVSDKDGYAVITAPGTGYLLAVHKDYIPDTIRKGTGATIYLDRLAVDLEDVVITNAKARRVLRSAREYVVDYDFVGDDILIASYSGNNGRNAKLLLLNDNGDTLAVQRLQDAPLELFKSCTGRFYCVCNDALYPLEIDAEKAKISIREPYDIRFLPMLRDCEQKIGNTFYYHSLNRNSFVSEYSLKTDVDSLAKPFYKIEQPSAARGNADENEEIAAMLSYGDFNGAAKLNGLRGMRNNVSYRSLGLPLFKVSDSLIIFDFNKKKVAYFSPAGAPILITPIAFDPGKAFRVNILQDHATGKFYLYTSSSRSLEEINMRTGKKETPGLTLLKFDPGNIKVHKGNVYYLWQDPQTSSTRQLYRQ